MPGVDDLAAVLPRAGADVDDVVGDADGLLVVLDHEHGVADVAQPHQRVDQPLVVPLVEPDRRLVEDVQHPDQAGADLGGQPDPLRLATGQGAGRAGQGEVAEPDVEQEPQPGADLLQHPLGDVPVPLVQLEPGEAIGAAPDATARKPRGCCARRRSPPSDSGLSRAPPHAGHGTSPHVRLVLLPAAVALGVARGDAEVGDDALVAGGYSRLRPYRLVYGP